MDRPGPMEIRPMRRQELDLAVEWAAREGWNPGLADAECFQAADSGGFLMGFVGGEPVACISVVRYGRGFGFLGFYIVRPDWRGRGYGFQLWEAGLDRLADRIVGLDGVVAQQDNYRRSGFVLAHRNVRYGGAPRVDAATDARIVPVVEDLISPVLSYDTAFFPADREAFLRCWLRPERRTALALVEDGSVRGYGVIRACRDGFKIGPLFAESAGAADLLFRALAAEAKGSTVFLDVPEPNRAAVDLASRYGLAPAFETARMYRGPAPSLPLDRIFGITTFELG
jgi:ribosomal protein S18 acetylase RimI-like enzyme